MMGRDMFQNPYMTEEWYAENKQMFGEQKEHHDHDGHKDGHKDGHMDGHKDGHKDGKHGKKDKKHDKAESIMNDVKDVFGYDSAVYLQTTVIATVMIAASALI